MFNASPEAIARCRRAALEEAERRFKIKGRIYELEKRRVGEIAFADFEKEAASRRASSLLSNFAAEWRPSSLADSEKKPQQVSAGASFWVAKGDQIPNANTAWAICVKIQ